MQINTYTKMQVPWPHPVHILTSQDRLRGLSHWLKCAVCHHDQKESVRHSFFITGNKGQGLLRNHGPEASTTLSVEGTAIMHRITFP